MRKWLVILLLLFPVLLPAQQINIDSLWAVWEDETNPDTIRLDAAYQLIWKKYLFSQPDTALLLANKQYEIAKKSNILSYMSQVRNSQGSVYYVKGNYPLALEYFLKCLDVQKKMGSQVHIASTLNNIGIIYKEQEEYDLAMEYFQQSYDIREALNDTHNMAIILNNVSVIHKQKEEFVKALEVGRLALSYKRQLNNKKSISTSLQNLGELHYELENYDSAYHYFSETLSLKMELEDQYGASITLVNLGDIYLHNKQYQKAIDNGEKALKMAQEVKSFNAIFNAAYLLMRSYRAVNRNIDALKMYDLYIANRDSVNSMDNSKKILQQRMNYEHKQQQLADSVKAAEAAKVKDAQLAAQRAENARQQQQAYYLYGGLALALLFGGFIFNRFRVTRKQKNIIEEQKTQVDNAYEALEEKNQEIIDSINYAKRLQEAILPPQKLVKEYLQQSFILYKPKDIVAGDFYWMETAPLPPKGGETIFFAAADCTGHGVPGAMVSVVCSNALSKALIEENITDVGKLLDRTRELVVERFGRSEENIQDGMDISLCKLEVKNQKSKVKLQYAGANNPLWVIRKGATEVEETKADKQPIGKYDKEDPFTAHTLQLNQGDSIYIFSDGYPDQFGGPKGKKYKTGAMKKFLLSIQDKDMATQRQLLNEEFENWKGELEQIDDVCVVGVRI